MAYMKIEVAASSSAFSYVSLRDHNRSATTKPFNNKSSQTIHKNRTDDNHEEKEKEKEEDSKADHSWLPSTSSCTRSSEPENTNHRNGKNVVDHDDSWLPTRNEPYSNEKHGANTNQVDNDIDYSWLPTSFIENNMNNKMKKNNHNKGTNPSPKKKPSSGNGHWALARKVVFSSTDQQRDSSSESMRYVVESPTSGGVSSLLQRWRDLAEAKNAPASPNSGSTKEEGSGSGSGSPHHVNKDSSNANNADWESDKLSRRLSCPLPSRDSKDSNPGGAEKEKIRVVDIIKKLSREEELAASHAAGQSVNGSLPPIRTNLHHQNQFECKVSRHLIRGREAFNNFLMQMENQKHQELKWLVDRKAVSKFSHRGRIQALLRFKILRLGTEPKPESKTHRRCISKTLESNNRLDIMDLRERFNTGVEKGATNGWKSERNNIKNTTKEESLATTSTTTRVVDFKTTKNKKQQQQQQTIELVNSNQSTQYITNYGKDVGHEAKFVDTSSKSIVFKEGRHYKDENKYDFYEDEGQFMSARTSYSQVEDRGISDLEETIYTSNKQGFESFSDWVENDYSHTPSYLDEEESYEMGLFNTEYDWISDISRPKSDWEHMRQTRYQEMLNYSSGNGDIRRLLERKTVSRFLRSGLRDLIDQLMVSRIQQSHILTEKQDTLVMRDKEVGQENGSVVDEDGDCRSRTETKCSEYGEYVDQPYSEQSWRHNNVVNNSETTSTTTSTTTTSPSTEHSHSTNRSQINSTPHSPSPVIHRSIEMELIYNLKGHMEQLHQEIMELRKSIKICVNMQVKMQQSLKQNVTEATTTPPVEKKEKEAPGLVKHNCCVCHVMQVDSLLYKCGHMCTCFNCATEVQHTSGECPVCEAPIIDVVKAFTHQN